MGELGHSSCKCCLGLVGNHMHLHTGCVPVCSSVVFSWGSLVGKKRISSPREPLCFGRVSSVLCIVPGMTQPTSTGGLQCRKWTFDTEEQKLSSPCWCLQWEIPFPLPDGDVWCHGWVPLCWHLWPQWVSGKPLAQLLCLYCGGPSRHQASAVLWGKKQCQTTVVEVCGRAKKD